MNLIPEGFEAQEIPITSVIFYRPGCGAANSWIKNYCPCCNVELRINPAQHFWENKTCHQHMIKNQELKNLKKPKKDQE